MPITWEYFTKRFSISTEEFIRKYDCKSYEDLCSKINHDDILPPAESEVKPYFSVVKQEPPVKKPAPRRKPAQKKQSLGTKSSAKSLSRQEIRKRAQSKKVKRKTEEKSE